MRSKFILACLPLVAFALGLGGCASKNVGRSMSLFEETESQNIYREDIGAPANRDKRIEFFWSKPNTGKGPWPTLVFIHDHQEPQRPGGRDFVRAGLVRKMAQKGILAISLSLPGYGSSDGPADYAGSSSREALSAVLDYMRELGFADPKKTVFWGMGRGALVAGLAAAEHNGTAAAILINPIFELEKLQARLKASGDESLSREAARIAAETGNTEEAYKDRSLMARAASMKAPVLVLDGAKDETTDPGMANEFAQIVNSSGGRARVVQFPEYSNYIPADKRNAEAVPFLNENLAR